MTSRGGGAAPLLDLRDVRRSHRSADGGFQLRVPELRIAAGERVVVVGQSGSGKSTLLDLLALLAAPDGAARFCLDAGNGPADILDLWAADARNSLTHLRAHHVGYVLQTGGLLPYLSVRENILLARRLLGLAVPGPLAEIARAVGLDGLLDRLPSQLSVGQRQRAAVARALAHAPRLLLADEPTAALDPGLAGQVMDALLAATEQVGAALVLVTHDMALASRVGGRILRCEVEQAGGRAQGVLRG